MNLTAQNIRSWCAGSWDALPLCCRLVSSLVTSSKAGRRSQRPSHTPAQQQHERKVSMVVLGVQRVRIALASMPGKASFYGHLQTECMDDETGSARCTSGLLIHCTLACRCWLSHCSVPQPWQHTCTCKFVLIHAHLRSEVELLCHLNAGKSQAAPIQPVEYQHRHEQWQQAYADFHVDSSCCCCICCSTAAAHCFPR